jgi:hypothetical protein
MTESVQRPPRKNPILRTRQPTLPPWHRSRIALGLTAATLCELRCGSVSAARGLLPMPG